MNKLSIQKQTQIIHGLLEGCSIRSLERMTGTHRDTIMRLGVQFGNDCEDLMYESMRNLPCKTIQVDEIWCFVGKKQKNLKKEDNPNLVGDQWVWVSIDADTKLVPNYWVGKRSLVDAMQFLDDLSERLVNRVQLSSDKLPAYVQAVKHAFGDNVDYGQLVKTYETEPVGAGRYSPPKVVRTDRDCIIGNPDKKKISTSYIERQNLTMRMSMRRFTRLTNGFSKKLENLKAAVSMFYAYYNFCRVHSTIKTTPAVAAGVVDREFSISDL